MAACLRFGQLMAGVSNVGVINADGTKTAPAFALVQDTVTADVAACQIVAISGAEYMALKSNAQSNTGVGEVSGSLLSLTPEQAAPVAAAVFGVWAIAWAAKQAIRTLRGSDEKVD